MKFFFKCLVYLEVFMATSLGHAEMVPIFFKSRLDLEKALLPLNLDEVVNRIASSNASFKLNFQYDGRLATSKVISFRNPGVGNLLNAELYKTKTMTVYYPEKPRVPHHLTIALNRREIKGIADISEEENAELFEMVKKIVEIYQSISIQGFVLAQFDTPQQGQRDRYVVEIIPHLPGFQRVKNIVDKMDCNRYILFRNANISPVEYTIPDHDKKAQIQFWQSAFMQDYPPIRECDIKIAFPAVRKESHQLEAEGILYNQLIEMLRDKGGKIEHPGFWDFVMPLTLPEVVNSVRVEKCAFCEQTVISRQLIYEYEDVLVFYNTRKVPKPGSCFLLLPKRHTETIYGLNSSEIQQLYVMRKALVEVLKDAHPECQVIVYTQDDPAVGQTVFHSHEQVVAVDPETMAMIWTMLSLYPSGNVSNEEMLNVREKFGLKLKQKIQEMSLLEAAI